MENHENDMPFMKFPKIYENMAEFKFPKKIEWIATEKIDGSNFSVYSNGAIVKFAKRTGFLNNIEDWFFNYQLISWELSKQANQIYQIIKQKEPKIKFIIVYGELNGGFYPEDHKNWTGPVPSRINAKGIITIPLEKRAIQEGVYYNNKISLIVFDIGIVNAEGILNYLEYDEMVNMCKNVNLPYTHLLIKGNIQKMLDYSLEFNSTIPALFGLPPLEYNKAERIVIRPVIWNGPGDERPMLKRKNKKFKQFSGDFDINQVKKKPNTISKLHDESKST